jgi:hypothetical protein
MATCLRVRPADGGGRGEEAIKLSIVTLFQQLTKLFGDLQEGIAALTRSHTGEDAIDFTS